MRNSELFMTIRRLHTSPDCACQNNSDWRLSLSIMSWLHEDVNFSSFNFFEGSVASKNYYSRALCTIRFCLYFRIQLFSCFRCGFKKMCNYMLQCHCFGHARTKKWAEIIAFIDAYGNSSESGWKSGFQSGLPTRSTSLWRMPGYSSLQQLQLVDSSRNGSSLPIRIENKNTSGSNSRGVFFVVAADTGLASNPYQERCCQF